MRNRLSVYVVGRVVVVVVVPGLCELDLCKSVGGIARLPLWAEEDVSLWADDVRQQQGREQHAKSNTQRQHLDEIESNYVLRFNSTFK